MLGTVIRLDVIKPETQNISKTYSQPRRSSEYGEKRQMSTEN